MDGEELSIGLIRFPGISLTIILSQSFSLQSYLGYGLVTPTQIDFNVIDFVYLPH